MSLQEPKGVCSALMIALENTYIATTFTRKRLNAAFQQLGTLKKKDLRVGKSLL